MLVAARLEVVKGYLGALADFKSNVLRLSTGEIARYNLSCLVLPQISTEPCVVASLAEQRVELSLWAQGVLWRTKSSVRELAPEQFSRGVRSVILA